MGATTYKQFWAMRLMDTSSGQRRCWRLVSITCDLPPCRVQEVWALDADDQEVYPSSSVSSGGDSQSSSGPDKATLKQSSGGTELRLDGAVAQWPGNGAFSYMIW